MELKTWVKPELIVISRSQPEESVLEGCKAQGLKALPGVTGPEPFIDNCVRSAAGGGTGAACRGVTQS